MQPQTSMHARTHTWKHTYNLTLAGGGVQVTVRVSLSLGSLELTPDCFMVPLCLSVSLVLSGCAHILRWELSVSCSLLWSPLTLSQTTCLCNSSTCAVHRVVMSIILTSSLQMFQDAQTFLWSLKLPCNENLPFKTINSALPALHLLKCHCTSLTVNGGCDGSWKGMALSNSSQTAEWSWLSTRVHKEFRVSARWWDQ